MLTSRHPAILASAALALALAACSKPAPAHPEGLPSAHPGRSTPAHPERSTPAHPERSRRTPANAIEHLPPVLGLQPQPTVVDGEVAVTISYARPADEPAPRLAEFHFQVGSGLTFVRAEPLDAVVKAGKQLVAQVHPGNVLRLLIFSTANLNTLDSGPLATLVFQRTGTGPTTLDLLDQRPIFAPPEADLAVGPLGEISVHAEAKP